MCYRPSGSQCTGGAEFFLGGEIICEHSERCQEGMVKTGNDQNGGFIESVG